MCLYRYCLLNVNFILCQIAEEGEKSERKHQDKQNSSWKDNVLLVSFDALGWEYLNLVETPVLNSFKTEGVYADYMINIIPTGYS